MRFHRRATPQLLTPGLLLIAALSPTGLQAAASGGEAGASSLLLAEPPEARPGQCWAQLILPSRMERRVESVERKPAGERVERLPARYQWVERQQVLPAGRVRVVTRAAEYEVSEEQVLVSPATSRSRQLPPRYRSVEERQVTRTGPILKPDPKTGQPCVVEGPVEFQIVHRQVLVEPARSESVEQPARYRTQRHRTLLRAAETRWVDRPERTVTRRVREQVEPEREIRVPTPAVREEVVRLIEVEPARHEWRQVLCETNLDAARLAKVQRALQAAGFATGSSDGRWGPRSAEALRHYQQREGLAQGGLSLETLERLGVAPGSSG